MPTPDASPATILVATDNVTDAALVKKHLEEEFPKVAISTVPDAAAQDFERHRPDVLVLAFDTLEKAERYYLGLYRLCPLVQQHAHRTIILCNKDEVKRVYELCKKNYFDDYVLFWPMTYDMSRLAMSVHHALRELAALKDSGPSLVEFAAQAHRLTELESLLDARLSEPAVSAAPLKAWADGLRHDYAPHMEAARALGTLAERVHPTILVADDDEFQRKIVARILEAENYRVLFAGSGLEVLSLLRKTRPDLILMDVMMPDLDGVETTRRLKAVPQFAAIPVFMITGKSEKSIVAESLKAGASGFLVKPFERDTLLAKVAQALRG